MHDPARLIDAYLDGLIDAAAMAELDRLIRDDPSIADLCVARTVLHRQIIERTAVQSNSELATRNAERPIPFTPPPPPPHPYRTPTPNPTRPRRTPTLRPPKRLVLPAAAALLLAAALAIYLTAFNPRPETRNPRLDQPVATILDTTGGSTLLINDAVANSGDDALPGDYALDTGSADFRLTNGVEIALRGQTQLTVHSPMSATLTRGEATFDCPPDAVGYTVHLPSGAKVIDLGTAFTVNADVHGVALVHVTDGLVRIDSLGRESVRVRAGHMIAIAVDGAVSPVTASIRLVNLDFNGPTGRTGTGKAVWGQEADRWNALVLSRELRNDQSLPPLIESTYRIDELVDTGGKPTGIAFEATQPQRLWHVWEGPDIASEPVRSDTLFLYNATAPVSTEIAWRITGLVPGETYELALLAQWHQGRPTHPSVFVIEGHDPATLDDQMHAVFATDASNPSIHADAHGEIRGVMRRRPDKPFAAWAGFQLRGPLLDATSPDHAPTQSSIHPRESDDPSRADQTPERQTFEK